jgi:importin subunit beta-1
VKTAITVLESKTDTNVHEEVYLLVSGLTNILEEHFARYLQAFLPYIISAIKNWQLTDTCETAIRLIGHISRALEGDMACICDQVITVFLELIMTPHLPFAIKTAIISAFGDISLAIKDDFTKYLGHVLPIFKAATEEVMRHRLDTADEDELDIIHSFCLALVEGIQGLLQGVGQAQSEHLFPYIPLFIALLAYVSEDKEKEENIARGAVGLIGDMILLYGESIVAQFNQPFVKKLLKTTEKQASDEMTHETVQFTRDQLLSYGNIKF